MQQGRFVVILRSFLVWFLVCVVNMNPAVATASETGISGPRPETQIQVSNCDVQAAIDKCETNCTISIPAGTCALNATLNWAGTGKKINLECASTQDTVLSWPVGVIGIAPESYSRIAHCDLRGPNTPSIGDALIESGGTTDIVIEGNIIEQSGEHGINTGGGSLRWAIRNNTIQHNHADGVFLASGTSDSIVADNIITGNGSNGIDCNCSGSLIHGNISKENGLPGGPIDKNGILISGILGGSSANFNSVVGNETSFNGGSGITIRADLGTTADYNVVSGNVSHDNGGTSQNGDGIQVDGSDLGSWTGNTIVANTSYKNQRYGIEVDGQNAASIETTLVSSNVSMGNGNTGIMLGGPKVADTLVVNNIVMNNPQAQIADNGSTRSVIGGNKENMSNSLFVIKGGLLANTVMTATSIPPVPITQNPETQNAAKAPQALLLTLDSANQTILRGSAGPKSVLIQTPSGVEGASMTDAGAWNFPSGLTIGAGISRDGGGIKHQSVQTGLILPASSALIKLTWTTAFADGNYDPQCNVVESSQTAATLRIHHIESFGAGSITALIVNDDDRSAHFGVLHCLGIHE
jgi:hypothetical protein